MKIKIFTLTFLMGSVFFLNAQVGIGTNSPDPDSDLTLASTDKGLLMNKVALTSTTSAAPLSTHVKGMFVYNTATTGDVTEGIYYNDGTKWVSAGGTPEAASNDWTILGNSDATATTATLGSTISSGNFLGTTNTQNLVLATDNKVHGILNTTGTLTGGGEATSSFGWGNTNTIGTKNNTALGNNNTANGQSSVALGDSSLATGDYSVAIGRSVSASGLSALSIGGPTTDAGGTITNTNSSGGTYSTAIGFGNNVTGNKNTVMGIRNKVTSANTAIQFVGGTTVLGNDNTIGSLNTFVLGSDNVTSSGASTILGRSNGTVASPASGFILGTNNNSKGGFVFGSLSSAEQGQQMILGFGGTLTAAQGAYVSLYSNNKHSFLAQGTSGFSNVAINVDATSLSTNQSQSDLTVSKQIRIVGQAASTICNAETLGAIRFNTTTGKHQGCGKNDSGTINWYNLY